MRSAVSETSISETSIAGRYVGQRVARKEDLRLLRGKGQYVDDMLVPGMLHAAFVRSPHARARILKIDTRRALAAPGVQAVYTCGDLASLVKPFASPYFSDAWPFPRMMPLADRDARFAGDPVALVIAEDRYAAEDAAELVEIDYEPQEPVLDYLCADQAPPLHAELKSNLICDVASPGTPELQARLQDAAHVFEESFHQQRYLNVPLETRGLIASFSAFEGLTVWLASQGPHTAARYFGYVFGLPDHQVRVVSGDVGGGFGLKVHPNRDEVAVIAASRLVGRAVKWIEDRVENLTASNHARLECARVRLAFDEDYRFQAASFDYQNDAGAYPWLASLGFKAAETFTGPYRIPHFGFRVRAYYTNTCGLGAYRGPWLFETVARETALDMAAKQFGIDPLELRRRNVLTRSDQPYRTPTHVVFDDVSPQETLEQVVEMAGIAAFRAEQAEARKAGRYLGLGLSVYMEPTANMQAAPNNVAGRGSSVAEARIEPSGHALVTASTHSAGHSTETTMAQIAAEELGLPLEHVRMLQGDTSRIAFGAGAGGSRQAVAGGGAVKLACAKLRSKVLRLASHMLEAAADDLTIRDGVVSVKGVPDMKLSFREIAERAYFAPRELPQGMEPGLDARARYAPPPLTWANAAHACKVEVDVATGLVKVLRWWVSEDCGVMINPDVVEGQIAGGIVQGIGGVLLEHARYDGQGNPVTTTFRDYLLPLAPQAPEIEFRHLCTPSGNPGGFKGAGEGGAIIAPSTLTNAICDALSPFGFRCTRWPLSPAAIVELLESGAAEAAKLSS